MWRPVHAPHERQVLAALPLRPVVLRRPAHAQQRALPRKTQRSVPLDHPPPLRPAQRLSPRRKKSRSTVSSPILACRSRIFASCSRAALRPAPPAKHLRQLFEQQPLPCGHLVRMKLVPRRDRLHAVPLAQRLERYPCLELRRETAVSSWPSRCLLFRSGIHLNDLSKKPGPPQSALDGDAMGVLWEVEDERIKKYGSQLISALRAGPRRSGAARRLGERHLGRRTR